MSWAVTYRKNGLPPFVLRGQSAVRYAGDKIVQLTDSYEPSVNAEFAAWQRQSGLQLDPSYT